MQDNEYNEYNIVNGFIVKLIYNVKLQCNPPPRGGTPL